MFYSKIFLKNNIYSKASRLFYEDKSRKRMFINYLHKTWNFLSVWRFRMNFIFIKLKLLWSEHERVF